MKIHIVRKDGTTIDAEGTPEELKKLIDPPASLGDAYIPYIPYSSPYPFAPWINPGITYTIPTVFPQGNRICTNTSAE